MIRKDFKRIPQYQVRFPHQRNSGQAQVWLSKDLQIKYLLGCRLLLEIATKDEESWTYTTNPQLCQSPIHPYQISFIWTLGQSHLENSSSLHSNHHSHVIFLKYLWLPSSQILKGFPCEDHVYSSSPGWQTPTAWTKSPALKNTNSKAGVEIWPSKHETLGSQDHI